MIGRILGLLGRLSALLFLPVRRLFGPLHRRRRKIKHDQNDDLPPPLGAAAIFSSA